MSTPWLIPFGSTDIEVSRIAFGAGPVSNLLTDSAEHPTPMQFATIQRALDLGINWFDTAATYARSIIRNHCIWRRKPASHRRKRSRSAMPSSVRWKEA